VQGRWIGKIGAKVRKSYDLRTDQEGEAKIPEIPQGQIRLLVNAKGYQTYGQTLTVEEEEKTLEVKLNPPQPQYSAH
jgi:short-subunit dehydrogenase